MRNLVAFLILLLGSWRLSAGAPPRSAEGLLAAVQKAIREKSLETLGALYYLTGLSAAELERARSGEQVLLNATDIEGITLEPLPETYRSVFVVGDKKIEPTLSPVGLIVIARKAGSPGPISFRVAYATLNGGYYLVAQKRTDLNWTGPPDKPIGFKVMGYGQDSVLVHARWSSSGVDLEGNFRMVSFTFPGQYIEHVTVTTGDETGEVTLTILEGGKEIFVSELFRGRGKLEYQRNGEALSASKPAGAAQRSNFSKERANQGGNPKPDAPQQAARAITRLAIGSLSLSPSSKEEVVADLLVGELSSTPRLELVERRELAAVLREASLSLAGLVRAKDAVRAGALVRADQFLLGSSVKLTGTNFLVIRLVDAHTGAIQDLQIFREPQSLPAFARELAEYVRAANEHPPQGQRDYLAIGVMQNQGVNNRFADFPAQTRGYLAAHLGHRVTLLERDMVSYLAEEIRMDRAGLSKTTSGEASQVQFGFWLVDGFYESYEVKEPVVQLKLRVERILGGQRSHTLQGKPDERFLGRICDSVIQTLDHPAELLRDAAPTREGEIKALQARAAELVDYEPAWRLGMVSGRVTMRAAGNPDKLMNTLDEAIRVFEAILLLDPDNNEAKMRLAACLLFDPKPFGGPERTVSAKERARAEEYYREVLAGREPAYRADAAASLALFYGGLQGVTLLWQVAPEATDPKDRERIRNTRVGLLQQLAYNTSAELLLPYFRAELREELEAIETNSNATVRVDFEPVLFPYRTRPQEREHLINELLPELVTNFPDLEPYLLLEAAGEQITPSSPVTARFLASLKECEARPEKLRQPKSYFTHLSSTSEEEKEMKMHGSKTLLQRMFGNGNQVALTNAVLARARAAEKGLAAPLTPMGKRLLADVYAARKQWKEALVLYEELPEVEEQTRNECRKHLGLALRSEELPASAWTNRTDELKVELAYQCIGRKQWRAAVEILESMGHRTVSMYGAGPWGVAQVPVLPAVVAEQCRLKAGMPKVIDPLRFELRDMPYIHFLRDGNFHNFAIELDGEDVWVATYNQVKRFHGPGPFAAAAPTESHELKRSTQSGVTGMAVSRDYVWSGTQDDGLFELDRRTGAVRRFTMNDGLFLNSVCGLYLQGQTLWIGYRNGQNGTLGTLEPSTHKFAAFTPALAPRAGADSQPYWRQERLDRPQEPPQFPVAAMAEIDPGEMWFAIPGKGVQRFRCAEKAWSCMGNRFDSRQNPRYIKTTPAGVKELGWLTMLTRAASPFSAMAGDPGQGLVVVTLREPLRSQNEAAEQGGLILYDYRHNQAEWLQNREGLPNNDLSAVALDGRFAWVGGYGFVAVVDVLTRQVARLAFVSSERVQGIRLDKTYAWIQIACGKDSFWDAGDAWNGVYRLRRAAVESGEVQAGMRVEVTPQLASSRTGRGASGNTPASVRGGAEAAKPDDCSVAVRHYETEDIPKPEVAELFDGLAQRGDVRGTMWMARCYDKGRCSLAQNPEMAQKMATGVIDGVKKLAEKGDKEAQFLLGSAYQEGLGVEPSLVEAMRWYQKAADAGQLTAMNNLAIMLAHGHGMEPDVQRARLWFGRAAALGSVLASKNIFEYGAGDGEEPERWTQLRAVPLVQALGMQKDKGIAFLTQKKLISDAQGYEEGEHKGWRQYFFRGDGVVLEVDVNGRIVSVEGHAKGSRQNEPFRGELPLGLTWKSSLSPAQQELGSPDDSGDVASDVAYGLAYRVGNLMFAVMFSYDPGQPIKLFRVYEKWAVKYPGQP